jgi:hypothetical protein
VFLDKGKLRGSFVGDLDLDPIVFMPDIPGTGGVEPLAAEITEPAWRIKPAWYQIATEGWMILPDAEWFRARLRHASAGSEQSLPVRLWPGRTGSAHRHCSERGQLHLQTHSTATRPHWPAWS